MHMNMCMRKCMQYVYGCVIAHVYVSLPPACGCDVWERGWGGGVCEMILMMMMMVMMLMVVVMMMILISS